MDVADWLRALGLEQYEATFRENAVGGELLPDLTDYDLKELGITPLGHRRQLLKAIAALRIQGTPVVEPSPPSSPTVDIGSLESTAERRPLSVMFCDLIGSTALSVAPRSRGSTRGHPHLSGLRRGHDPPVRRLHCPVRW